MSEGDGGNVGATTPGDDDKEHGAAAKRSWHAGHLPRMPRAASDDEPDFVTGWFQERLLDGALEDGADDQEHAR